MIKLIDLVAGETVLVDKDGEHILVLEVFRNTALVSMFSHRLADKIFTEWQLNEYFTIYTEQPRIPEPTDYTKLPKVRYKEFEQDDFKFGYFVCATSNKQFAFIVCESSLENLKSCEICEYYEWT
jgi:hypothetical protein